MNRKTKFWFILLENVNYTAENLFNISAKCVSEPMLHEFSENLNNNWIKDGYIIEKKMIYNIDFLYIIEDFLIKNGIYFNWIEYQDETIGIRIHPTTIDFYGLLADCMSLERFSWHREYMKSLEKGKKNGKS